MRKILKFLKYTVITFITIFGLYLINLFLMKPISIDHYLGKENDSLNKISTCVLEQVDVAYGGDRFQAYDDGVPQQTKLSLKFKEMEIITKSRIAEGY